MPQHSEDRRTALLLKLLEELKLAEVVQVLDQAAHSCHSSSRKMGFLALAHVRMRVRVRMRAQVQKQKKKTHKIDLF